VYDGFHSSADTLGEPAKKERAVEGKITLTEKQTFVIHAHQGMYFLVVEEEHPNYQKTTSAYAMRGQLKKETEEGGVTTPPEDTYVEVFNEAIREVSIENTTPNEGIGTAPDLTNAGGKVIVETTPGCVPDDGEWTDVPEVPNAMAVLWEPDRDRFWLFGESFTISWVDFGPDDTMKTVTISDYLNPDGTPKPLNQATFSDPGLRTEMLDAGAQLTTRRTEGGFAIRLVLSSDPRYMPRTLLVQVKFEPTIAVRNVTDGYIGGTVVVNGGGTASNRADGVPDYGGRPYRNSSVYGKPDPGYVVDWDYILIRNLNDLDGEMGEPVLVEPDENGRFKTRIRTEIADGVYYVEKEGWVKEGSIVVGIDSLPVSLQIDLRFIPEGTGGGGPGGSGSGVLSERTGGLPRTGVESVIVMLIIGLVTSLLAGTAVVLVIRYQNAKERRFSK